MWLKRVKGKNQSLDKQRAELGRKTTRTSELVTTQESTFFPEECVIKMCPRFVLAASCPDESLSKKIGPSSLWPCPRNYCYITNYSKTECEKPVFCLAHDFVNPELGKGLSGQFSPGIPVAFAVGCGLCCSLRFHWAACPRKLRRGLAVDAGCRVGVQLVLSTKTPTCGLFSLIRLLTWHLASPWARIPGEPRGSCMAFSDQTREFTQYHCLHTLLLKADPRGGNRKPGS